MAKTTAILSGAAHRHMDDGPVTPELPDNKPMKYGYQAAKLIVIARVSDLSKRSEAVTALYVATGGNKWITADQLLTIIAGGSITKHVRTKNQQHAWRKRGARNKAQRLGKLRVPFQAPGVYCS